MTNMVEGIYLFIFFYLSLFCFIIVNVIIMFLFCLLSHFSSLFSYYFTSSPFPVIFQGKESLLIPILCFFHERFPWVNFLWYKPDFIFLFKIFFDESASFVFGGGGKNIYFLWLLRKLSLLIRGNTVFWVILQGFPMTIYVFFFSSSFLSLSLLRVFLG